MDGVTIAAISTAGLLVVALLWATVLGRQHQKKTGNLAVIAQQRGWEFRQDEQTHNPVISGQSSDNTPWRLVWHTSQHNQYRHEIVATATIWQTDAVQLPQASLCLLGKQECIGFRKLYADRLTVNAPASEHNAWNSLFAVDLIRHGQEISLERPELARRFTVLTQDPALSRFVFDGQAQELLTRWPGKHPLFILLGDTNLRVGTNAYVNDPAILEQMVMLGEQLAHNYRRYA